MDREHHGYHPAHLFIVRLWPEELGDGLVQWRVQLRSVETGAIRYFHDWPTLINLLRGMAASGTNETQSEKAEKDIQEL